MFLFIQPSDYSSESKRALKYSDKTTAVLLNQWTAPIADRYWLIILPETNNIQKT